MKIISKITVVKNKKTSMAVPLPEDIRAQMAKEGIFTLLEKNPALPTMGVKEIRERLNTLRSSGTVEFLNNIDPDTALLLPFIYKPSQKNFWSYFSIIKCLRITRINIH